MRSSLQSISGFIISLKPYLLELLNHEDGGITIHRNVGNYL